MAFGSTIQFDSNNRVEVKQRKELAQAIVENAFDKVEGLGIVIQHHYGRENSKVRRTTLIKEKLYYQHYTE